MTAIFHPIPSIPADKNAVVVLLELKRQTGSETEQLLQLYWNRANVKRELVSLRKEHDELRDKLKDGERALSRAHEQLEGLERLLVDPVAAANAMVYFQLRHLWRVASTRLDQLRLELIDQRERRERAKLHADVIAKRKRRLTAVNEKLTELLVRRKEVIDSRVQAEKQRAEMNPLLRLVFGRRLRRAVESARQNQGVLDTRIDELNELVDKIRSEALPEPEGLSLDSKRIINVALIAMSQHLVMHFLDYDLARLARQATECPVADMKFGDRGSCDRMVQLIRERLSDLDQDSRLAEAVKRRSDLLIDGLRYLRENDTIPRIDSVGEIARDGVAVAAAAAGGGTAAQPPVQPPIAVNVLSERYWDVGAKLL